MPQPPAHHDAAALLRDADGCVRCGACLPVCPTYAQAEHEGDSPRGRITLAQALLAGALVPDATLAAHLDGCLHCRACERICPAQVPITRVIRGGSQALRAAGVPTSWGAFLSRQRARLGWVLTRVVGG